MKKVLLSMMFLGVIFALAACDSQVIKKQGLNGVILTEKKEPVWAEAITTINKESPTGYWVPSKNQVLAAESKLKAFLGSSPELSFPFDVGEGIPSNYRKIWEYLEDYYRQYIGFTAGDKKMIYVNCVAKWAHSDENWASALETPFLMGGGIYRFEAVYDVQKGEFVRLEVTDGGPE